MKNERSADAESAKKLGEAFDLLRGMKEIVLGGKTYKGEDFQLYVVDRMWNAYQYALCHANERTCRFCSATENLMVTGIRGTNGMINFWKACSKHCGTPRD